jgi:hypothetical protein
MTPQASGVTVTLNHCTNHPDLAKNFDSKYPSLQTSIAIRKKKKRKKLAGLNIKPLPLAIMALCE